MNAGGNTGGGMIHAILEGKIVSAPKEYGAFTGFEAAAKKLTCEKDSSTDEKSRYET